MSSSESKIIISKLLNRVNNTECFESNSELSKSKNKNIHKSDKEIPIYNSLKIINKINYCHILKSFFCFKDKLTKFVKVCHNIIREDMCIERFLERFYNLENAYNYFYNEKKRKFKSAKDKRFIEGNKYINKIIDEIRKDHHTKKAKKLDKNLKKE